MSHVLNIRLCEQVSIEQDRLSALFVELGESGAEDVVCRAMEELVSRMSSCGDLHAFERWDELRKCVRSMIAIADQIGMTVLARVCSDVIDTIDQQDRPATAATLARVLRLGEQSFNAIWDVEDATI